MLNVGVSQKNITPDFTVPLGGYLDRYLMGNRSKGVLDNIFVGAVYLEGTDAAFLISTEVLVIENDYYNKLVDEIHEKTGVSKKNIFIAATHTHSAPESSLGIPIFQEFYNDEDIELIRKYMDFLRVKIVDAAVEAKDSQTKSELLIGRTEISGSCSNRIDPNLESDREIITLRDIDKRFLAYFYTCHPTVLSGKNMLISGDFPSYTNKFISKILGENVIPLFFNGAAGDQSTRFVRRNQTPEEARRIGEIVAKGVIKAIEGEEKIDGETIQVNSFEARLPRRNLNEEGFKEKLERKIKEIEGKIATVTDKGERRKMENELMVSKALIEFVPKYQKFLDTLPDPLPVKINTMRVGPLKVYAIPAELFCRYGLELKANSGTIYSAVMGYANGYNGYFPTPEAYDELDYESLMAIVKRGGAERMVKQIIEAEKGD
ncbi:MAG: hypothetical protein ACP6IP_05925 [Candidatus Njordarchaeia archaeon]